LARGLAKIDIEKASKQDVEMLKKLIVEFKDELDALGVKVDQLDERVAVLEKDLGGWSLAGELRFDVKFTGNGDENNWYADDVTINGKNEFDLNRYRLWIRKRIDENTNFTARLGSTDPNVNGARQTVWQQYYVTTKLPYDVTFRVGRQPFDLEGDLGLYNDNDSWFVDATRNALRFDKSWGVASFLLAIARNDDDKWIADKPGVEQFLIAANINANFNEKFRAGLIGYWLLTDEETQTTPGVDDDHDLTTYGGYLGFKFTPAIELKGLYYTQDQGANSTTRYVPGEDNATAWKVMLDVEQEALKFTSLWLEYGKMDNNFEILTGLNPYAYYGAEIFANRPKGSLNTTTVWLISAAQQWNDKWSTLLRYAQADFDVNSFDNATNWTFEVGYQYSPAIAFTLGYDNIDYGEGNPEGYRNGDDHLIRFRTFVTF
jgi:hypothetical protein